MSEDAFMKLPSPEYTGELQSRLLAWFEKNKRPLPWRETYAPYAVWISEIMLQQTQMERGVDYFKRWMLRFPDMAALATASEEEVLKLWEGLGYYSRARNLHKAAQMLHEQGAPLPDTVDGLRALPGVGPYTAAAIASLAFNRDEPVIDANVERVFARIFDLDAPVKEKATRAYIERAARALLPSGKARDFNQALMEFGALVCSKRPRCAGCVLSDMCESHHLGIANERPVPAAAKAIIPLEVATGFLAHNGRVLIQKRLLVGAWPGLWELPGGRIEPGETPEQAIVREYMEETGLAVRIQGKLGVVRHGYTTYRVALHCFALRLEGYSGDAPPEAALLAATENCWALRHELARYAFPAGHRKLLDRLEAEPMLMELALG